MKMIISPAKKMNRELDILETDGLPEFLEDTEKIMSWLQKLDFHEAMKLWGCNEKIAELNFGRLREMNLREGLTPAILSYEGIQYQYMAPAVFTQKELEYVKRHLRILSGFYGVLRPMDGVTPYRLEMQARAKVCGTESLYDFWKDRLYRSVVDESRVIINLASKEYAKCIEKFLRQGDTFITCIFGEMQNGRIVQKGTMAKMARGEMVRFMAENQIENPEQMQAFDRLGYRFQPEISTKESYIFVKQAESAAGHVQDICVQPDHGAGKRRKGR